MVVAVVADVGEGGVARVDAGVDRADDDALALDVGRQAELSSGVPQRLGALPLRADVGVQLAYLVGRDRRDGRIGGDRLGLLGREDGREAVDRVLVGEGNLDASTGGPLQPFDELGLDRLEVAAVRPRRRALGIELLAGRRFGRREAGLAAAVARNRRFDQADQVGGGVPRDLGDTGLLGSPLDAAGLSDLGRFQVAGRT